MSSLQKIKINTWKTTRIYLDRGAESGVFFQLLFSLLFPLCDCTLACIRIKTEGEPRGWRDETHKNQIKGSTERFGPSDGPDVFRIGNMLCVINFTAIRLFSLNVLRALFCIWYFQLRLVLFGWIQLWKHENRKISHLLTLMTIWTQLNTQFPSLDLPLVFLSTSVWQCEHRDLFEIKTELKTEWGK